MIVWHNGILSILCVADLSAAHICVTLEIDCHIMFLNNCFHLCPLCLNHIWFWNLNVNWSVAASSVGFTLWYKSTVSDFLAFIMMWMSSPFYGECEKPFFLTNTLMIWSMLHLNLSSSTWNKIILCMLVVLIDYRLSVSNWIF